MSVYARTKQEHSRIRRPATAPRDELVPEVIGPKYALRIHDLRNWHVLQVTCWKCGHISMVYPSRLRRRWSGYERLMDIERKFRCTKLRMAALGTQPKKRFRQKSGAT
jgi:hypothetical protein